MTTKISLALLHPSVICEEINYSLPAPLRNIVVEYLTGPDIEQFAQLEELCISPEKRYFVIHLSKIIKNELRLLLILADTLKYIGQTEISSKLNKNLQSANKFSSNSLGLSFLPPMLEKSTDLMRKKGHLELCKTSIFNDHVIDNELFLKIKKHLESINLSDNDNKYFQSLLLSFKRQNDLKELKNTDEFTNLYKEAFEDRDLYTLGLICARMPSNNVQEVLEKDFLELLAKSDQIDLSLVYAVRNTKPIIEKLLGKIDRRNSFINFFKKSFQTQDSSNQTKKPYINFNSSFSVEALIEACRKGDYDAVKNLIEAGISPNHTGFNGRSPLHTLLLPVNEIPEKTTNNILNFLIQAKADVHAEDTFGFTPLAIATVGGRESTIKILQNAGAVWKINSKGQTTLGTTAANNGVEGIKLLIKAKANIEERNLQGETPLIEAASYGNRSAVEELLKSKADVNAQSKNLTSALIAAASRGHARIAQLLLDNKANPFTQDSYNRTALDYAFNKNLHACVRSIIKLIPKGEEADLLKRHLFRAANFNEPAMLQALLESGIDINQQNEDGDTPLMISAAHGKGLCLEVLINAKADIHIINEKTRSNTTALSYAAASTHEKETLSLIAHSANVESPAPNGQTILGRICKYNKDGCGRIVSILIEARANVNHQDQDGQTPLILAIQKENRSNVSSLIKAKAEVNLSDKQGFSPLMHAVIKKHSEIVGELIFSKANVDQIVPDSKETAILFAAQAGLRSIVFQLINSKADLNLKRSNRWSVLDTAAFYGRTAVVRLLVESIHQISLNELSDAINAAERGYAKETADELREVFRIKENELSTVEKAEKKSDR